jgi:hypothetical protein
VKPLDFDSEGTVGRKTINIEKLHTWESINCVRNTRKQQNENGAFST